MGNAAVKAAKAVDYSGAGTVEFIYDYRNRKFYFMEMNTRIQVEHPVTEMVTGIDLIKGANPSCFWRKINDKSDRMLRLQAGQLSAELMRKTLKRISCHLQEKLICISLLAVLVLRIDSAAYPGYTIPPYYDSMIAKVITYGTSREEAISRMKRALSEFVIEGIHTTIPFHLKLLEHEKFVEGQFNTKFLELHDVMKSI